MFFRDDMKSIADEARAKVFAAYEDSVDVIVTIDPTHVGYLTGYRSVLLDVDRTYRCAAIATRDSTLLVVGAADAGPALEVVRDPACIYRYGTFYFYEHANGTVLSEFPAAQATFMEAVAAGIKASVTPQSVLGIDAASTWELSELRSALATASTDVRPSIMRARRVKTETEIAKIGEVARITELGLAKAIQQAAAGVTELELSAVIAYEIRAAGGIPRFVVVAAGERAALADAYATPAELKKGDLVRFDIGSTLDGYWADTARTIVIGEPTPEQQSRYDSLLAGELEQLATAKPGLPASELFRVAIETVRKGALDGYQRTHCGHGIGLGAHEFPTLNAINHDVPLEEGMVLCVETPYYELGWGGMMVEDTFVVRRDGPELLTNLPRALVQA